MKLRDTSGLAFLTIVGFAALIGCGNRRSADVSAIKQAYSEFRTALVEQDLDKATNYISSDLLARYPNHRAMIADYFRTFTNDYAQPGNKAWVEFDRKNKSEAFVFPQQPPTVGCGFVKETNGWKITVKVWPVMD